METANEPTLGDILLIALAIFGFLIWVLIISIAYAVKKIREKKSKIFHIFQKKTTEGDDYFIIANGAGNYIDAYCIESYRAHKFTNLEDAILALRTYHERKENLNFNKKIDL